MTPFWLFFLLLIDFGLTTVINRRPDRMLFGDDQLEDSLDGMIGETELTPKYAVKRVKQLTNQVNIVREKCTKYLYVIRNFISFYQMRKQHEEDTKALDFNQPVTQNQPNDDLAKVNSLSESLEDTLQKKSRKLSFKQPQLKDFGSISADEKNFAD